MDKLTYELKELCKRNRDGSYGTQAQRRKQLRLIAAQLKQLGYRHMGVRSLKTKHVLALVKYWQTQSSKEIGKPISTGTIKNRMSSLRWWAGKINKPGVIPKDNITLGIPHREYASNINRAFEVGEDQLKQLPTHIKMSIRLEQAFGLRREEAAKFVPAKGIKEGFIQIYPSWTKGGRQRTIPITTDEQREVLKDIAQLNTNESLIPASMEYRQYIGHQYYHLGMAGIKNQHGLRHGYAQQRYIALTNGRLTPPKLNGGKQPIMSEEERALDRTARLTVSQELGHSRIDITRTYLG